MEMASARILPFDWCSTCSTTLFSRRRSMRWTPGGRSSNLEDRRGATGGGGFGRAGMGIGGTVVLLILSLVFGRDFIGGSDAGVPVPAQSAGGDVAPIQASPAEENLVQFVSFVLDDAQKTWATVLPQQAHTDYHDAKLVLYRDAVQTGCGNAPSAVGPFYCPADERVYIDLSFYDELRQRYGAPGDFAQAYVLAHEIGHHVQHLMGTDARVRQLQESRPGTENALSVRMELQADCYAGVWANSTEQRRLLQTGDVDEALTAASAVGDDRLQKQARGGVNPDTFTHGTAAQRANWFKRGLTSGDMRSCDTFAGAI
jgi:predicted metalloprotease